MELLRVVGSCHIAYVLVGTCLSFLDLFCLHKPETAGEHSFAE